MRFSTLAGPGTVEEALADLKENARLERVLPVRLDFEVVAHEAALPVGHSLTITGVERDGRSIRITYEIRPPLSSRAVPPRVEARDDSDHEYHGLGGKQVPVASFTRYGFQAAALTVFAVRAMAVRVPPETGPERTAILWFDHPYAAVAVSGQPDAASRESRFAGLPLFSAWVGTPSEAEDEVEFA